ncbi:MAG: hypothetical protein IPO72_11055 [Saprospiraceae bacterium]|nr:hypothetical protein [Candidatus Vicinibacter affinis]
MEGNKKEIKMLKADLCRIFNTIANNNLLLNPNVPWETIQLNFEIDGVSVKNLKTAASNKKIDEYSENIVKSAFKLKI